MCIPRHSNNPHIYVICLPRVSDALGFRCSMPPLMSNSYGQVHRLHCSPNIERVWGPTFIGSRLWVHERLKIIHVQFKGWVE